MFSLVGLLAASALLGAAPQQELTLQQVLKANTAAVQAIRSIHVTIEVTSNYPMPGDENPPEPKPTWTYEWYKDGARERVRQNLLRGRRPHNRDASNGPKGYKALHNYDPNIEPPPSESFGGHAGGELDKTRTDNTLAGPVRAMSFMHNLPGAGTLEEYVAKYPSSKLAATPATSKLGCYEITTLQEKFQAPGSSDDVKDVRVFVDPKVGFWVRRIESGPWQKSTDPGDKGVNIVEVEEFKDCGNGIFWPLRGHISTRLPGRTSGLETFVRHILHSINRLLPEEDFEVRFPDWLIVNDRTTGQVFVWGPDDKPRMTFASLAEFVEWDRPRVEAQLETGIPRRSRWMWLVGISLFVGLMLALILWRRNKTFHRLKTALGSPEMPSPSAEPERK